MLALSIGFLVAFALIFLQVPIATALGLVGFGGVVLLNGWTPALSMAATITRDSTLVYTLIVLPLFVLMGNLVAGAGISGDLFRAAQAMIGRRRGGVAMATVAACGAFGAICGSSVATAATMGKVAIPEMRRQRHAATFKVLVRNDLSHWAERFLRMLDHPPGGADTLPLARAAGRR